MKTQITAHATVQVTIQVHTAAWGEDCTIGQLYKQAAEDAINQVRNLRHYHGGELREPVKIVGQPKVLGVITEKP